MHFRGVVSQINMWIKIAQLKQWGTSSRKIPLSVCESICVRLFEINIGLKYTVAFNIERDDFITHNNLICFEQNCLKGKISIVYKKIFVICNLEFN